MAHKLFHLILSPALLRSGNERAAGRAAGRQPRSSHCRRLTSLYCFSFFLVYLLICKGLVNQRQWILWLSQEALKKISKRASMGIMTEIDSQVDYSTA